MFRPEYTLVAGAFVFFAAARWAWKRGGASARPRPACCWSRCSCRSCPGTIRNIVVLDRLVPI